MPIIGLDIGGANLKAATSDGTAASRAFEIWKAPERLAEELQEVLSLLPAADALAVTMTAELADCFETKAQGVAQVLNAVGEVAGQRPARHGPRRNPTPEVFHGMILEPPLADGLGHAKRQPRKVLD